MTPTEYLAGRRSANGSWTFELGRELHGAFGGAFGGVVAASTLIAARPLAAGRVPTSLDCRFLRGIPAGEVRAVPELAYEGRSLAAVRVDMTDSRGKLAACATISFADPSALADIDDAGRSVPAWKTRADGKPWKSPPGVEIPILDTFEPRSVGSDPDLGSASSISIPWKTEDVTDSSAESACLAADLCVGPPVAAALRDRWVPHPNPDLSLRFVGSVGTPDVVGAGYLERIQAGVAAVSVTVSSGDSVVAKGVSTSLLLAGRPPA